MLVAPVKIEMAHVAAGSAITENVPSERRALRASVRPTRKAGRKEAPRNGRFGSGKIPSKKIQEEAQTSLNHTEPLNSLAPLIFLAPSPSKKH